MALVRIIPPNKDDEFTKEVSRLPQPGYLVELHELEPTEWQVIEVKLHGAEWDQAEIYVVEPNDPFRS
jgi:hypothetical protein